VKLRNRAIKNEDDAQTIETSNALGDIHIARSAVEKQMQARPLALTELHKQLMKGQYFPKVDEDPNRQGCPVERR
jgi:hypothetical protein